MRSFLAVFTMSLVIVVPAHSVQKHAQSASLPTVITDAERMEVAAVEVHVPPHIDGVLSDSVWATHAPVTGFIQAEPYEGRPATERTEVWVCFDSHNLYIAARLYYRDPDEIVVSDIKRDFRSDNQDTFEVILDTFGDRRNGYVFATNAEGARADRQVTNEGREINSSWDAPWTAKARRSGEGWMVEMAIPFEGVRSANSEHLVWGINFSRRIRHNNEVVFWAPIPRAYALTRLSLAGNLTGLKSINRGRDLRITPYVLGRTVRETGGTSFDQKGDGGVDIKYGVTNGLTLDLTVNPDFAQVEADAQLVNLTQFSQFFPEKRDFFLENSGLFFIGDTPRNTRVSTAPRGDEDLLVFFSRRMGLSEDGRPIPIDGGLRLTGQAGDFQIGAMGLRTRETADVNANDYGVFRLRRNLFANSDVGTLIMTRVNADDAGDYNYIYGGDANIRLPGRVDWSSFFLNTETPGVTGPRYAFQTSLNREANFVHAKFGLLAIGDNFNDELGFVRRTGVRKWSMDVGIRPRFAGLRRRGVREMHPHLVWKYITNQSGKMLAKSFHSGYTFFLNNGGYGELSVNPTTETLSSPLSVSRDAPPVPAGRHDWTTYMLRMNSDASKPVSVSLTGIVGGLWTGTQRTIRVTTTVRPSYKMSASLGLSRTAGDLNVPDGDFVSEIWTMRGNVSFTTNMFVGALVQYLADRDLLNVNVRFNFIHGPLSDLFIVYNEQRFTSDTSLAPGRSVILKFTQMLGF
ncbi:MAG: DUF5916 domain-containing protein [Gemmatimonadales bacterium]